MSLMCLFIQVQKKNYREEKKRATKELLSTITDPSVIVMADWLKVRFTVSLTSEHKVHFNSKPRIKRFPLLTLSSLSSESPSSRITCSCINPVYHFQIRGTLKSWTKLWCVLKPGVLLIYKTNKNGQWVGTVLLNACELIERPSKKDGFCFKLFHPLEQSIWAVKVPGRTHKQHLYIYILKSKQLLNPLCLDREVRSGFVFCFRVLKVKLWAPSLSRYPAVI